MPEDNNQKGSQITDSMVNEEVLGSSNHILAKNQHGGMKGLQQFYTPEKAAQMIVQAVSKSDGRDIQVPTFDPTAGDGSLLKFVNPTLAFGVEIDKDQVKAAEHSYQAIQGDLQKVFPLIYRACPEFPLIFCNPPFGLKDWHDPTVKDGKPIGSARLTYIYASRILSHNGQIVFMCGKDQFEREIAELPEASGIYYVVECDDLFEGTSHPAVIAFAVHNEMRHEVYKGANNYENTSGYETKKVPLDMLDLMPSLIRTARTNAIGTYNDTAQDSYWPRGTGHKDAWEAIGKEYRRRRDVAEGKERVREHDIELVGGKIINAQVSPYATVALSKLNLLADIRRIHGKSVDYFANYEKDWKAVEEAMAADALTVAPKVIAAVEDVLRVSRRTLCPLYPINDVQRLGYLTDLQRIECKLTDEVNGFEKGMSYELDIRTGPLVEIVTKPMQVKSGKDKGDWVERKFEISRKVMTINIRNPGHTTLNMTDSGRDQEEIAYLVKHFTMPDPGDVGSNFPQETEENRQIIRKIEKDVIIPNSQAYAKDHPEFPEVEMRHFQVEDLARLLVKKDGMLAWEQGLGKTLAALTFTKAAFTKGAQECALFIVPQDLIPQWQRECKRFLGVEMTWIKTHGQAKNIAKKMKMGGKGLYVTHFEALSVNGTNKSEMLPEVVVETKTETVKLKGTGRYGRGKLAWKPEGGEWVGVKIPEDADYGVNYRGQVYDKESREMKLSGFNDVGGQEVTGRTRWVPAGMEFTGSDKAHSGDGVMIHEIWNEVTKNITSAHLCPECKADRQTGWNGSYCRAEKDGEVCGYSHYLHRVKPMGSLLSVAFKKGVVILDEGTAIQGDYSLRSTVIRGINGRFKLLMSGTPIKNYIPQAFWPLWWALGNNSKRFPYDYAGGKTAFENNHAVIQYSIVGGKKTARKVLPEVTNLSHLWRLLASSIIRRRKEETGEPLVKRTIHPITVPHGVAQREQMEEWRKHFHEFFAEKYPDSKVVKAGAHEVMAPMLGMGWKLDYAATMAASDPDFEWTQVDDVSNFTPNNLRTLEMAMALVKQGRNVLIGTHLKFAAKWMEEQLQAKGVAAASLINEAGETVPPAKRSTFVEKFQKGEIRVLIATIQALRLGHNLDKSNAAIINGLPWDYESFDQFIARIHRLTSKKEVDIYVVIPGQVGGDQGTITRRKWDQLILKGDASTLALDGRLIEQDEEPLSEAEVMGQMMDRGIAATGDEILESEVERLWNEVPTIDIYEAPEGLLEATLDTVEGYGEEFTPREAVEAVMAFIEAFAPMEPEPTDDGVLTQAEEDEARMLAELAVIEAMTPLLQPKPEEVPGPFDPDPADDVPVTPAAEVEPEQVDEPGPAETEGEKDTETVVAISAAEGAVAIKEFAALHAAGALSSAEFEEAKKAILAQMFAKKGVTA